MPLTEDIDHSFYVIRCTEDSPLYSVQSLAGHYIQVGCTSIDCSVIGWPLYTDRSIQLKACRFFFDLISCPIHTQDQKNSYYFFSLKHVPFYEIKL